MTMLGPSMVGMIFVIPFGFIAALRLTMINAGGENNWVILSRGAPDEGASFITHDNIAVVRARPEIESAGNAQLRLSQEIFAGLNISRDKHVRQFVTLRGVTPIAYSVDRGMYLVSGRWPVRGSG